MASMPPQERQRRIVAARLLRGIDQAELARLGHEEGLDKQELARLERGEFGDRFSTVQCKALSRILRVPEAWFHEDDVDVIVGYERPAPGLATDTDLRRLAEAVENSAASLLRLEQELAELRDADRQAERTGDTPR